MFKRIVSGMLALILVIALIATAVNVNGATKKRVGFSSISSTIAETEKYVFKLTNFDGKIRSGLNKDKNRVFVEIKNANYTQMTKSSNKKKIAAIVKKSKYLKRTYVSIINKKKRLVKYYFVMKKGTLYSYAKNKKGFKITFSKETEELSSPSSSVMPTIEATAQATTTADSTSVSPTSEEVLPTPIISNVIKASSDNSKLTIKIPRAEYAQFTPTRKNLSEGGNSFEIPICGLDNYLSQKYEGDINILDGALAIKNITINRTTLTATTRQSSDLMAYKEENSLNEMVLNLKPHKIENCWYTSYFRKAFFRINMPYFTDFGKQTNEDGTEFTFTAPTEKLDLRDGKYTFKDNLLSEVEISTQDGIKQLKLKTNTSVVFKVSKGTGGKYIKIAINTPQSLKEKLIVLDAGHGGKDAGAVARYTKDGKSKKMNEKTVNLKIVLLLDKFLTDLGMRVELTRYDDRYVSLTDRYKYANDIDAKLFMSVHQNAYDSTTAQGTETYYYKNKKTLKGLTDQDFATRVNNNVIESIDTLDRGVKTAGFAVIKGTKMTAILLETCFITNKKDRNKIIKNSNKKKVAKNLAAEIASIIDELAS